MIIFLGYWEMSSGEVQPSDGYQYIVVLSGPGIVESYMGPTAAEVIAITDDFVSFQGMVISGATTDDNSLAVSGTLSDGSEHLGTATVYDDATTWSFDDPSELSDSQSVSHTAQVADAAYNLSPAGSAYTATVDVVRFLAGTLISSPLATAQQPADRIPQHRAGTAPTDHRRGARR